VGLCADFNAHAGPSLAAVAALELTQHFLLLLLHLLLEPGTESSLFLSFLARLSGVLSSLLEHGFLKFGVGNDFSLFFFAQNLLLGFFANVLVLFEVLAKETFWLLLVLRTLIAVCKRRSYLTRRLNLIFLKLLTLQLLHLLLHLLRKLGLFGLFLSF
jgi:hypothetical protein